jgi:hypothetical protein
VVRPRESFTRRSAGWLDFGLMLGGFASPETNIKQFDLLRAEIENRDRTFDPVIRAGRPDLDVM